MLAGITSESWEDAIAFFKGQEGLREVHLLDVFAPEGFFGELAEMIEKELRFLEISYTYRHSDPAFLSTLPKSNELAKFVGKGLVGLRLGIMSPDIVEGDGDEGEGKEIGVLVKEKDMGIIVEPSKEFMEQRKGKKKYRGRLAIRDRPYEFLHFHIPRYLSFKRMPWYFRIRCLALRKILRIKLKMWID